MLLPVDMAYSYVGLSNLAISALKGKKVRMPSENIYLFEDHFSHSKDKRISRLTGQQRDFAKSLNLSKDNYFYGKIEEGGGLGICHRVMLNKINPQSTRTVIATDSHTPTIGALPVIAVPVGSTLFAAALAQGYIPFSVPRVTRVELTGKLSPGLTVRDIQLELACNDSDSSEAIEFGGPGLDSLSLDSVAALCNMVPEVFNRGKIAVCQSYKAGRDFLSKKFQIDEEDAGKLYGYPDGSASYYRSIRVDLSEASPWIALPGNPHSGVSLKTYEDSPRIQKAYLVSCTLGKEDLIEAAAVLQGVKVKSGTQLIIIPSLWVYRQEPAMEKVWQIFRQSGAVLRQGSACSSCIGEGPGAMEDGEIGISASNRNYPGRMGAQNSKVYLAGPVLTALAAVLGRIPTYRDYRDNLGRIVGNLKALNR
jgi:homoaconitase/3-isopropylmalate dehydratase large subunit